MGDSMMKDESCQSSFLFESKTLHSKSFQKLHEFLENDVLCDLEIRTGCQSFKCHRVVLAACSAYFFAMFTSGLSESSQKVISIKEVEASIMKRLIDFAYTARIHISCDNVQAVLHAASVLQLDALTQGCCQFMEDHLHPSNCLGVRQFAERHGLMGLVRSADAFALRHFNRVVSQAPEELDSISVSHLIDLISSSELCIDDETQVFEAVIRWTSYDIPKRKDLLPSLLSHVRLPLMPTSYLLQEVESHELIRNSIECRDLLDQARDYILCQAGLIAPNSYSNVPGDRFRPRKSCSGLLFCVGGRGVSGDPFASVECFSPIHGRWFPAQNMNTKRRHVGCVFAKGKLYAVGGCNEKEHLGSSEVFDLQKNDWSILSSMSVPRRGLGACFMGGALYAVGGLDDLTFFSTVERYDISTDSWATLTPMKTPRGGVAVAELKGHLYAIGGNNGPFSLSSCERFDPYLNKWSFVAPMAGGRAGAGSAVIQGSLYVAGGFDNNLPLSSVERYDVDEDRWVLVSSMQVPRGGVGVATLGGKLLACGGHNGVSYLNSVEIYDPQTNIWTILAPLISARAGAGVTWCPCSLNYLESLEQKVQQQLTSGIEEESNRTNRSNQSIEDQSTLPM